jgi:CheY-like chemotaxis protein
MSASSPDPLFIRWLRQALHHLYDPRGLRENPIFRLFGLGEQESPSVMRRVLVDAIESLKPARGVSSQSDAWRTYQVLSHRFVDQFSQSEVAANLGLSIRQLRRHEQSALQMLADIIWTQYSLQHKFRGLSNELAKSEWSAMPDEKGAASQEQELEWLEKTAPGEPTDCVQMIHTLLKMIDPLVKDTRIEVECSLPDNLPSLAVQSITIRQVMLNVLIATINTIPGGKLRILAEAYPGQVWVWVHMAGKRGGAPRLLNGAQKEKLEMARNLASLSGGSIKLEPGQEGLPLQRIRMIFSAVEQVPVLVIDDNTDTLQLFQRYLTGTGYRCIEARDPEQALELVESFNPKIIILDVMLPRIDGWELLGRLRHHPRLKSTPIIICTILPQEQLAHMLGAAAFLRKPFTRAELLAVLDRQAGSKGPGSG